MIKGIIDNAAQSEAFCIGNGISEPMSVIMESVSDVGAADDIGIDDISMMREAVCDYAEACRKDWREAIGDLAFGDGAAPLEDKLDEIARQAEELDAMLQCAPAYGSVIDELGRFVSAPEASDSRIGLWKAIREKFARIAELDAEAIELNAALIHF